MWPIIYWYLRAALLLGHDEYVYKLSKRWSSDGALNRYCWRRYHAAMEVQKDLHARGYFECPTCFWMTKTENEHIATGEGWCYEQSLPQIHECEDEPELAE
jgi:hypothetical protein